MKSKMHLFFAAIVGLMSTFFCCSAIAAEDNMTHRNYLQNAEDKNVRASIGYMMHRAWVQMTGKDDHQNGISVNNLDIDQLSKEPFAVAWLGHDTMLIRVGQRWVMTDPVFSLYATPTPPIGPKRLVNLPIDLKALPHIDAVLISHDHYDHLDLNTVKNLANQANGSPVFFVGNGLKKWFIKNVPNSKVEEMGWWEKNSLGDIAFDFVPAQHSSGRSFSSKNATLWGGWVIEFEAKKMYFAGDTAFETALFQDIKNHVGEIDLAALPVGAFLPRTLMQFEHMSPDDAVNAHLILKPKHSIGIHWGTFQLGDDTSDDVRRYFQNAITDHHVANFKLLPIGQSVVVGTPPQK